ncbi:PIN domain-containing protein [Candidatus Woesearchaeota archaeon]|nr:PIN domain-containing protein [Candidatus Woesearchaeota archaeon]
MASYYLDTYALIELGKTNPRYLDLVKGAKLITNKLNITELAYYLKRTDHRNEEIALVFSNMAKHHVDASDNALLSAVFLKFRYKSRKLSYIDCIGYFIAMENGAKFLTGDEKFSDIDKVEFVK